MEGKRQLEEKDQVGVSSKKLRDINSMKDGQEVVPADDFGGGSELLDENTSGLGDMELEGKEVGGKERMRMDSNFLLNIFPEEVWRMILDTVSDTDCLETLINASPFFRKLLKDKRILILFPKVWSILAVQYHEKRNSDRSFNEARRDEMQSSCCGSFPNPKHLWEPCKICGSLHAKHWYSGILRLRLVCQTWCTAIDQLFQNQADEYKWTDEPRSSNSIKRVGDWISYLINESDQTPQLFRNHFDGTHDQDLVRRNPFLNRQLSFFFGFSINIAGYVNQLKELLWSYGDHVWYCSVRIAFIPHQFAYLILVILLEFLPNLKSLSLYYPPPYFECAIPGVDSLRETIQADPMPALQNLKCLRVSRLSTLILNELIRVNSHVSMLEVGECIPQPVSAIFFTPMSNLTKLALKFVTEAEMQQLESSPHVTWQLRKLYLNFNRLPGISLRRIFTLLENKWANTLTELILSIQAADQQALSNRILNECKSSALNLANLQRLEVLMPGFFSLDWILPMANTLESLDVTVRFNWDFDGNKLLIMAAEKEQRVKFFGLGDLPLESNIWSLFPKLREVTFNKAGGMSGRDSKISQWAHTRPDRIHGRNF